jgi:hypothetical protein
MNLFHTFAAHCICKKTHLKKITKIGAVLEDYEVLAIFQLH